MAFFGEFCRNIRLRIAEIEIKCFFHFQHGRKVGAGCFVGSQHTYILSEVAVARAHFLNKLDAVPKPDPGREMVRKNMSVLI